MSKYNPEIKKEKKPPAKIRGFLIVLAWLIWTIIFVFDVYRVVALGAGVSAADLFCDFGILVIAVYFTVIYFKNRKGVKNDRKYHL